MILFLAEGRLGNQIFQYVFLKTIQSDGENIIVTGFEDLKSVFEIKDIINLKNKNKFIKVIFYRFCKPIFNFLSDNKIISSICVNHEVISNKYRRESTGFITQKGFLSKIRFVKLGFFQSELFFDQKIAKELIIKKNHLNLAKVFLRVIPDNCKKIFIHIRRADYKDFTTYGKSTLLPLRYFHNLVNWFLKNEKLPFFIFLCDEPELMETEFEYIENKLISNNNHFGTDLAIMTQCNSAILSPSSFGWWGSYLMKKRDIVFAPKYWLGFNSGIEYQCQGTPSFSKEIEIL